MSSKTILIIGARSDIGRAIAQKFAASGYSVQLAARNVESLERDRTDLELRYGVATTLYAFDALETESHSAFADGLAELPDIAVCVIGSMGKQADSEADTRSAVLVMRSNYEGPASILGVLANRFLERGSGTLVGISSVAGERGRATNYIYGSAKAGFTAFLSGLRNRLSGQGVHVVTVLPGFVATRMTEGMPLPAKLTAQPNEVADAVEKAVRKSRNVVYVRSVWRIIMMVIRNMPESIFKKTRI